MKIAEGRKDYRKEYMWNETKTKRNEIVETIFVNLATRVQLIV